MRRKGNGIPPVDGARELHDRIVALAEERLVIQGPRLRMHTTVLESDSSLSHR